MKLIGTPRRKQLINVSYKFLAKIRPETKGHQAVIVLFISLEAQGGLCWESQCGEVKVIQQWPPSGILPRVHPVGAGALEPAVWPHQTMAFCCKQSWGSLPGASFSRSLSLCCRSQPEPSLPACHNSGPSDPCSPRTSTQFVFERKNCEPGKVTGKVKFINSSEAR